MPKGSWKEFDDLSGNGNGTCSQNTLSKVDRVVRIQKTRGGKRGKTVTIIKGLSLNECDLKKLLKKLKIKCGTGGTIKEDLVELQGDQVKAALDVLKNDGFNPKQSGG